MSNSTYTWNAIDYLMYFVCVFILPFSTLIVRDSHHQLNHSSKIIHIDLNQ